MPSDEREISLTKNRKLKVKPENTMNKVTKIVATLVAVITLVGLGACASSPATTKNKTITHHPHQHTVN